MATQLSLFGHMRLTVDGRQYLFGETVAGVLLAFLGLHTAPSRMMSRSAIVARLWPDIAPERGNANLSNALYRLKSALGSDAGLISANSMALGLQIESVDVIEFRQLIRSTRIEDWQHALDLYREDVLIDLDADWIISPRSTLQLAYIDLLWKTCSAMAELGQYPAALAYALRWVAADPFNEDAHCAVMRLHARLGRYNHALQQYDSLVRMLDEELQVAPLRETSALADIIRAESIGVRSIHPTIAFVGRQRHYGALIVSLERALAGFGQIVMLTGTAGSGKTRLLQAFAESVTWRGVHTFWGAGTNSHPGKEPYHPLANALRQAYRSPLIGEHPSDRTAQLYQRLTSPTHMATRSVGSAVPDNGLTPDEFADLLALLGERMPCVLLLDHLEQATAAFWPALIAAAHTLIGKPVLIILAYREAALRSIPNAWSSVIALDTAYAPLRLELGELSYDACAELIVSYRLGLSQAEMTALYHKTGGHPATLIKHLDAQRTGDLGSSQNTRADQPVVQLTLLARLDAPLGRRLTDAERVQVRWTVDAGDLDATLARQLGNIALRRQRVARLIAEAINQGGLPTDADLAQALGVTERTIRADIASLRQSGMEVSTRRRADTLRKQHNSMDLRG